MRPIKTLLVLALISMVMQTSQAQDYFNWALTAGNSSENEISDMIVDDNENVYIVGKVVGTMDLDPSSATANVTGVTARGIYLAKYDNTGAFLWATPIGAISGTGLALNSSGSVIVYGTMQGTAVIGTHNLINSLSNIAIATYLAAFDSADGTYQGGKVIEGTGNQEAFDIKITSDEHIYIAGSFTNAIRLENGTTNITQTGTVKDLYLTRIDTGGDFVWSKTIATNEQRTNVEEIEIAENDNALYLTGIVLENLDFDAGTNLMGAMELNIRGYITKLDTDGSFQWTRRSRGTNNSTASGRSAFSSIEIDPDGNVTLVGYVQRITTVDGFGGQLFLNNTASLHIVKYSPTGNGMVNKTFGNTGGQAFGITHAIDAQGNYIITGLGLNGSVNFNPAGPSGVISFPGNQTDIFVVKYNNNLGFLWSDTFLGNSTNDRSKVLVEKNGNIYLAGHHTGGIDVDFGSGTTSLTSQGGADIFVTSLNNVSIGYQTVDLCFGETLEIGNNVYSQVGTYQDVLTGVAAFGKDSVINTTIASILAQITISSTTTDASCNGQADGQVTLTASDANTRNYEYSIDGTNFQTSPIFTNLAADTYNFSIKDKDNCTQSHNVTVAEPSALTASLQTTTSACDFDTGTITVMATGGTAPYFYSQDGLLYQSANVFQGLPAGQYPIIVKDANECIILINTIVAPLSSPTVQIVSSSNVNCSGGTDGALEISGQNGIAPYTYSIDGVNFNTTTTFSGLAAQAYTFTIKDANGCTGSITTSIVEPAAITIQTILTHVVCNGAATGIINVTATGGSPSSRGYEFAMGSGSFSSSNEFSGLMAGQYVVNIRDQNACTSSVTVELTEPAVFALSTSLAPLDCNGDDNGQISIDNVTGGTAPYTYSIDGTNFSTTSSFSGLGAGVYTVTIKDANNCTTTRAFTLIDPVLLEAQIANVSNVLCAGSNTGSITITATGGTGSFVYSIDGTNFQAQSSFTELTVGDYTVYVKDQVNCIVNLTTTITEPTALELAFQQVNITCKDANDGQVTGVASGGVGPYSYSLDGTNFQTGIFESLIPGDYTLTVRDAQNCTTNTVVTITEPPLLTMSAQQTNVTCNGQDDGTITVFSGGGTSGGGTLFINGQATTASSFTGLAAGTYDLRLLDANMCEATLTVTISEPDALTGTVTATSVTCNGDADGEIALTATGGTAPYEYSLDGATFQSAASFTSLASGDYTFTIRDANGCTATADATITQPDALAVAVDLTNFNTITAIASGGTAPYEYSIGSAFQSSGTFGSLGNGDYTVTARDANGCTVLAIQSLIVTAVDEPVFTPTVRSYPNPAQNYVMISKVEKGDVIQLVSLNGKSMDETTISKSQSDYRKDISTIRDALFIMVITDESGKLKLRQKIMRQH